MFRRKSRYKAPFAPDVAERYLSPFGKDVTPVKSFCAGIVGGAGCLNYGALTLISTSTTKMRWKFRLSSINGSGATRYIASQYNSGTRRSWGLFIATNNEIFIRIGTSDGTADALGISTLGVTPISGDLVDIRWNSGVVTIYINGILTNTVDYSATATTIYHRATSEFNIGGYFSAVGDSYNGSICDFKIWTENIGDTDNPVFYDALSGMAIDQITATEAAIVGTVDLFDTQDEFHYNLRNGVSKWLLSGATEPYVNSDYVWVPWVDGAPVVDTVAGATLTYSCLPVTFNGTNPERHNGCETAIRFPAGSAMDKSDSEYLELQSVPSNTTLDTNIIIECDSENIEEGETVNFYAKKDSQSWEDKELIGSASVQADGSCDTTTAQIPSEFFEAGNTLYVRAEYGSTYSSEESITVDSGVIYFEVLDAGATHSAGIYDGKVYCWGSNDYGQLGVGDTTDRLKPTAVDTSGVLSGKTIVGVACGRYHTLCLDNTGKVYAWGKNYSGSCGDGSGTQRNSPVAVDVSGVLSGKVIKNISAGNSTSYALDSDGKAYAWGYNSLGAIGDGTTSTRTTPVAVDDSGVLSGKTIVDIKSQKLGGSHVLALDSDGKVYAWGRNDYGQCGNGTTTSPQSSPVAVDTSGVLSGKTITEITCGALYSMCIADGKPYAWGRDTVCRFGNSTTDVTRTSPVTAWGTISDLATKDAVFLACGNESSLCIMDDNVVYGIGRNSYGQLGDGSTSMAYGASTTLDTSGVLSGKTIKYITIGEKHGMCMDSDNIYYAWGSNSEGQVGDNSTTQRNAPVLVDDSGV